MSDSMTGKADKLAVAVEDSKKARVLRFLAEWQAASEREIRRLRENLETHDPGYALEHAGSTFVAVSEGEVAYRLILFVENAGLERAAEYALEQTGLSRENATSRSTSVLANLMEDTRHSAWIRAARKIRETIGVRETLARPAVTA